MYRVFKYYVIQTSCTSCAIFIKVLERKRERLLWASCDFQKGNWVSTRMLGMVTIGQVGRPTTICDKTEFSVDTPFGGCLACPLF